MSPVYYSWLLAPSYVALSMVFLLCAWFTGGFAYVLLAGRNRYQSVEQFEAATGNGLFLTAVRLACGFAVISWVAALFGVCGWFKPAPVFATIAGLAVLGQWLALRYAWPVKPLLAVDCSRLGLIWKTASKPEQIISGLLIAVFCVLCYNGFVGALVPDFNQDPMWYHLSVPQQWVFQHRFVVMPDVMPSAYPLAAEAIFAVLLLGHGNAVFCSVFVAITGILLFLCNAGAVCGTVKTPPSNYRPGWGLMAALGIWIPLLLPYGFYAPLPPKNDLPAMLWCFSGAMVLWYPLLNVSRLPHRSEWLVGGILLGTACSAKPPLLFISFVSIMLLLIPVWSTTVSSQAKRPVADLVINVFIALLSMLAAMAPWMWRGYTSHGLPLFPLGRSLFQIHPQYIPLFQAFDKLHGVGRITDGGWIQMVRDFPARLAIGASVGEKAVFLYMVTVALGLAVGRGVWRIFALMLLVQLALLISMKGDSGVYRFFATAYCLSIPLLSYLVSCHGYRLRKWARLTAAALLCASAIGSSVYFQNRFANFHSVAWPYRPVLDAVDVEHYAAGSDIGRLYLVLDKLQRFSIKPDDKVLLLGTPYPFYLHRNVLWNDEVVGAGGLADQWNNMGEAEGRAYLRDHDIDVVLSTDFHAGDKADVLDKFSSGGVLVNVPLDYMKGMETWRLYRVLR